MRKVSNAAIIVGQAEDATFTEPWRLADFPDRPMAKALNGESGDQTFEDVNGDLVLAVYRPLPVLNGGLVVGKSLSTIREPFVLGAAVLATLSLIVSFFALLIFQRIAAPIQATLNRKAEELSQQVSERTAELEIKVGRGYCPGEDNKDEDQPIGVIPIDSLFSQKISEP